jgi:hypothetical protein
MVLLPQSVRLQGRFVKRGLGILVLVPLLAVLATNLAADEAKLSEAQRMAILRTLLAEHPFVHRAFPRGKAGVRIEGDKITPPEAEMNQLIAQYGLAAKPGERVQITAVRFEHHGIAFEINGGPVKRKNWRDRVSVGVNGVDPRGAPNDDSVYTSSTGSSVFLAIKDDASTLTAERIKEMLSPILDFKATSVAEAYERSLPPLLLKAIKDHHALVGMDKDMVIYTLGRPPRRVRESRDGKDYEEWIYGDPPQDVQFIRFLEEKVISIEEMKVSGEKLVRTQDEVGDLGGTLDASAKKQTRPDAMASPDSATAAEQPSPPPTLLRPGERRAEADDATQGSKRDVNRTLPPDVPPPVPGGPN